MAAANVRNVTMPKMAWPRVPKSGANQYATTVNANTDTSSTFCKDFSDRVERRSEGGKLVDCMIRSNQMGILESLGSGMGESTPTHEDSLDLADKNLNLLFRNLAWEYMSRTAMLFEMLGIGGSKEKRIE